MLFVAAELRKIIGLQNEKIQNNVRIFYIYMVDEKLSAYAKIEKKPEND